MPVWLWILIGIGAAAVVTAAVVVALSVWNRIARRHVVQLLGKREEARSLRKSVEEIVTNVREGAEAKRAEFAENPEGIERHSLLELTHRARVFAEEVNTMPMPARMVPAAEALADAADILAEESGRVGEGTVGLTVLDALDSIDLVRVDRIFEHAFELITAVREAYHVDDSTVFGGGLYI